MTGGIGVNASITARPSLVKPMMGPGPVPAHVVASLPRTSRQQSRPGTNRGHRRTVRGRTTLAQKLPASMARAIAIKRAYSNSWPGKYIAIHAPELVVKPDFQSFRRYRRPLLIRLENTHRLILGDHVRSAQQC